MNPCKELQDESSERKNASSGRPAILSEAFFASAPLALAG
jgi:hypothetical protein